MECIFFPYFSEMASLEIFSGYGTLLTTDLESMVFAGINFPADTGTNRTALEMYTRKPENYGSVI